MVEFIFIIIRRNFMLLFKKNFSFIFCLLIDIVFLLISLFILWKKWESDVFSVVYFFGLFMIVIVLLCLGDIIFLLSCSNVKDIIMKFVVCDMWVLFLFSFIWIVLFLSLGECLSNCFICFLRVEVKLIFVLGYCLVVFLIWYVLFRFVFDCLIR